MAHVPPATVGQLLRTWPFDPLVVASLVGAAGAYGRGAARRRRLSSTRLVEASFARGHRHHAIRFSMALMVIGVALVSPLAALSHSLASAHMAQHLLLIMVAPLLLSSSRASLILWRAVSPQVAKTLLCWRARRWLHPFVRPRDQVLLWAVVHTATVWAWHARGPYDAAVANPVLHALEHASIFFTALLAWSAILASTRARGAGALPAMLVTFGLSVQAALLGALLTFAPRPWYDSYLLTSGQWGTSPLADQQLAGLLMWVPFGMVYLAVAVRLLLVLLGLGPPATSGAPGVA